jgi:hypothetical protein
MDLSSNQNIKLMKLFMWSSPKWLLKWISWFCWLIPFVMAHRPPLSPHVTRTTSNLVLRLHTLRYPYIMSPAGMLGPTSDTPRATWPTSAICTMTWSHYRWATSTRNCYTWKKLFNLTNWTKYHLAHARAWLFHEITPVDGCENTTVFGC